jgi:hypothetical protein
MSQQDTYYKCRLRKHQQSLSMSQQDTCYKCRLRKHQQSLSMSPQDKQYKLLCSEILTHRYKCLLSNRYSLQSLRATNYQDRR